MPGPARAGAVIYAKDVDRLTAFYRELLAAEVLHADAGYAVVQSAHLQLVIHAIPAYIARTFEIATPPRPREDTPIKLFFSVASLPWAQAAIARAGGVFDAGRAWQGPGFTACDALDPEGNVIQLRVVDDAA